MKIIEEKLKIKINEFRNLKIQFENLNHQNLELLKKDEFQNKKIENFVKINRDLKHEKLRMKKYDPILKKHY